MRVFAIAVVLVLVVPAFAGTIYLKDGRTISTNDWGFRDGMLLYERNRESPPGYRETLRIPMEDVERIEGVPAGRLDEPEALEYARARALAHCTRLFPADLNSREPCITRQMDDWRQKRGRQ